MRSLLLAASFLLLASPASARCECVCDGGQMRALCSPTDLVAPICQGICQPAIQSNQIGAPLNGGSQGGGSAGLSSLNGQSPGTGLGGRF